MDINSTLDLIGKIIDISGVFIIFVGMFASISQFVVNYINEEKRAYKYLRANLSKVILLGLEFLIAGDIIRSVATTPSLTSAAVLALIVVIRLVLSTQLEVEITGRLPWKGRKEI